MSMTALLIGGTSPSRISPSSRIRATISEVKPCSVGAVEKSISEEFGMRMLTLPCPFAEMAPLATTAAAVSASCSVS